MQGPRLHNPFLSEPVEALDSDLGPKVMGRQLSLFSPHQFSWTDADLGLRSWADNSLSSLRISSLGLMRTLGPDLGPTTLSLLSASVLLD